MARPGLSNRRAAARRVHMSHPRRGVPRTHWAGAHAGVRHRWHMGRALHAARVRARGVCWLLAMIGPGFSKELRHAAAASQVVPRLVCEAPEEWRLGPLTVVLDAGAGTAQLRYARLSVARAPGDAAEIMAAW